MYTQVGNKRYTHENFDHDKNNGYYIRRLGSGSRWVLCSPQTEILYVSPSENDENPPQGTWEANYGSSSSIKVEVTTSRRLAPCDPTEGLPNATNPGSQRKPSGWELMERILREEARATQSSMEKFTKI